MREIIMILAAAAPILLFGCALVLLRGLLPWLLVMAGCSSVAAGEYEYL
jgi:uncharacterized protein YceK